jgi:hypothetical protein
MENTKDDLKKRVVTISGLEIKTTKTGGFMTKLTDEKGLKYNLFHTKKDGNESKAFGTYQTLPAGGIGKQVELVYKENELTNEHGTFTVRNIAMINVKND